VNTFAQSAMPPLECLLGAAMALRVFGGSRCERPLSDGLGQPGPAGSRLVRTGRRIQPEGQSG
jgi:hypothetical protein